MQAVCRVTLYDVTPPQATTKINRMAEWQNGGMADGMEIWQEWRME